MFFTVRHFFLSRMHFRGADLTSFAIWKGVSRLKRFRVRDPVPLQGDPSRRPTRVRVKSRGRFLMWSLGKKGLHFGFTQQASRLLCGLEKIENHCIRYWFSISNSSIFFISVGKKTFDKLSQKLFRGVWVISMHQNFVYLPKASWTLWPGKGDGVRDKKGLVYFSWPSRD